MYNYNFSYTTIFLVLFFITVLLQVRIAVTIILFTFEKTEKMFEPVVTVANANIYQGDSLILSDVNFTVNRGEFVYLVGKTGTGKSSLLKTLYGELRLREGSAI